MAADDNDNDRTHSMGDPGEGPDQPRIRKLGHWGPSTGRMTSP
jgi:hypothetical protein